ncbi:MAG: hypothetical protein Q8930_00545 [Bacillota bacterium]|nr:hypothetical protein [Bacillota bacterium]
MKRSLSKVFITALLWCIYRYLYNMFYPVAITPVAKKLVEDSADSVIAVNAYRQLWQYGWVPLTLLTLFILRKEIKMALVRMKAIRGENRNE